MTEPGARAELADVLGQVAARIATPEHSIAPRVLATIGTRPARRPLPRWLAPVAALTVALIVTLSVAPARRAVANLLGLGTTRVERVERLPGAPPRTDPATTGNPERLYEQLTAAGLLAPAPRLVGSARAWHVDPRRETVVAYDEVVFSQRPADPDRAATKLVPADSIVRGVMVRHVPGLWIRGPHVRRLGSQQYASESALLWAAGGVELRLEGDLSLDRMLEIARSVGPVR